MTCICTDLISGVSPVSLVSRPKDRMRLLRSSLRSFSGPAQLHRFSVPECWAGPGNEAMLVSRNNLSSAQAACLAFSFVLGLLSLCSFCSAVVLSRSILRFSAFRLLRCLWSSSRVTSRTRLCHIDDPRSFENFLINCLLDLLQNMAVRNTSAFSNISQRDYRYSTNTKLTVRRTNTNVHTYIHTYRHRLRSTR